MIYDIQNYGAVGDGVTVDTASIQKAIDACHENGGGQVLVPGGRVAFLKAFVRPLMIPDLV